LLNRLAEDHVITVYSEVPIDPAWQQQPHRYRLTGFKASILPRRLREMIFICFMLIEQIRNRFDVIHAHSTYPTGFAAVILQKLFGVPAVVSLDGAEASVLPEIKFGDLVCKLRRRTNRWVINNARSVTALTEFQRKEVQGNLDVKRAVTVVPRGIDLNLFFRERADKVATPTQLLAVGYINAIKDYHTLLDAFVMIRRTKDCHLTIVGRDYSNGEIVDRARKLGVLPHITWKEHIPYESMPAYYRNADMLLHTSLYESQGMVVVEAMASGVVVCGTDVGIIHDLRGQCCIAVPPRSPELLAEQVTGLLADELAMATIRKNAYHWVKANNVNVTRRRISDLYDKLSRE